MEQPMSGIEMDQHKVLQRILKRASALWGVDHPRDLDPMVKLILEVLGYELSGLNQNLHQHQGRRLENVADLLLPDQWQHPAPAHGIISALPIENENSLTPEHQFYLKTKTLKYGGTESIEEHFFTPLGTSPLVKGHLSVQIHEQHVQVFEASRRISAFKRESPENMSSQEVWIAFDLNTEQTDIEQLCLFIELPPKEWRLIPMLKHCRFETAQGQEFTVKVHPFGGTNEDKKNELLVKAGAEEIHQSIIKSIGQHYHGEFISLSQQGKDIALQLAKLPQALEANSSLKENEHFQVPRFWIKVSFPAAFQVATIARTRFKINTLPVVNRKLQKLSLRLHPGPNIIRLDIPEDYHFFGVQSIIDDSDRSYTPKKIGAPSLLVGCYSVHNMQLERIDQESAQDYLSKLIRIVREDSALFKAYGYEIMLRQMNDLKNSLQEISRQIKASDTSKRPEKYYLLLQPHASLGHIDIHYWLVPHPWDISSIGTGSELQQYKGLMVEAGSCTFNHPLHPAKAPLDDEDKIRRLLGSIVSKERIVSKADIKLFIQQSLGSWVSKVSISGGVSVSSDPKRGFVRTTDISLEASPSCPLSSHQWESLLHGLTQEINQRSIHTAEYRMQLTTQAVFQND